MSGSKERIKTLSLLLIHLNLGNLDFNSWLEKLGVDPTALWLVGECSAMTLVGFFTERPVSTGRIMQMVAHNLIKHVNLTVP